MMQFSPESAVKEEEFSFSEDGKFQFRKLTHEDAGDIARISKDVWDGADYLPEVFHDWVDAPGFFMGAVDAITGEVIGTAKYSILDDGKGWLEGLRVRTDYRGKKIATLLTNRVLDLALKAYRAGETPAVGFSTHITSEASIKMMTERHFKTISEQMIILKSYEAWTKLSPEQKEMQVEPWTPTYEEFAELPFIQRRSGVFNFMFIYQKPTPALHQALLKKGVMLKVNGFRGFYCLKGEPNFMAVDESFEAIDAFANYALSQNMGTGRTEPISYILGEDSELNEKLQTSGYVALNNWEKDYYYYLYDDTCI